MKVSLATAWPLLLAGLLAACIGADGTDTSSAWSLDNGDATRATPPAPPAPVWPPGMDSAALDAAFEHAATLPRLRALIVARDGEIQAERAFRGPGLNEPANVKSVSKSVLSAL